RNLKFGNRAAMTFCATHQYTGTCPSSQRQRAVKEPEILKRRGDRRLLRPVWVATHGVGVDLEVKAKG
ncbi:hypothetical protein, partial [Rahnella sp. AN3-3W3]|uniref:hypothetical protein n=1 Tax=Rahnella sp. AN3-3W3 TaxID=1610578 RepID=UPI001E611284